MQSRATLHTAYWSAGLGGATLRVQTLRRPPQYNTTQRTVRCSLLVPSSITYTMRRSLFANCQPLNHVLENGPVGVRAENLRFRHYPTVWLGRPLGHHLIPIGVIFCNVVHVAGASCINDIQQAHTMSACTPRVVKTSKRETSTNFLKIRGNVKRIKHNLYAEG